MEFKRLGTFIKSVSEKNSNGEFTNVLGVSIEKEFMPSVANIIGTDLKKYNILRKNRFAFNPMHVGRDKKLPIAVYHDDEPALVSPAYNMFEISDRDVEKEYLMLLFKTKIFDHLCWFYTDASVRGGLTWKDFCDIEVQIPTKQEQLKIIENYKNIQERINNLKEMNEKLVSYALLQYKKMIKNSDNKVGTLKDIYDFQYGKGNNNPDNGGKYPIYGSNGIIGGYTEYNNEDIPVIGHIGSCGSLNFAFGKVYVTYNGVMCNIKDKDYKYFGYLTLMNSHLDELNIGTTQPFLSYDMLYDVEIKIPSKNTIVEFDKRICKIFNLISENNKEIIILEKLEKIFLSKYI